jgi:hypothetical protein
MINIGKRNLETLFTVIYDVLPISDVSKYMKKLTSDTNIESLYDIAATVYSNKDIPARYYHVLVFLLCSEAITIDTFKNYLKEIKEYEVYFMLAIELNRLTGFNIFRKKKVVDYIPKLSHGTLDYRSYKDIKNIFSEIRRILVNSSEIEYDKFFSKSSYTDNDGYTDNEKYYDDLTLYIINNYIMINGDFINLSYINNEFIISSEIINPDIWNILPDVSFYLNENIPGISSNNVNLDVDIDGSGLNSDGFNLNEMLDKYKENAKAKEIAKLLPIILDRTINYNEI